MVNKDNTIFISPSGSKRKKTIKTKNKKQSNKKSTVPVTEQRT